MVNVQNLKFMNSIKYININVIILNSGKLHKILQNIEWIFCLHMIELQEYIQIGK